LVIATMKTIGCLAAVLCVLVPMVWSEDVTCDWTECDKPCDQGIRTCYRSNGKIWHHHCHVQSCERFDGCGKADIVYVLDASSSIGEKNFWVLKQFTIDVMKGLWVAPDESRIATVTYANHAETLWGFSEYSDEATLEEQLWDVHWTMGTTNTADGLQHGWEIIKEQARGEVKHIVILITDGESNVQQDQTIPTAEAMQEDGIEIFVIGIGQVNEDECRGIASEIKDEHFHYVPNYNALVGITNSIINDTCAAANKTQCDPWSDWSECIMDDADEDCGSGYKIRTTTCYFWKYPGDPDVIEREANQTKPCYIPCPTTTTTELPTTTTTTEPPTTTTTEPPTTTTTEPPTTTTTQPPTTTTTQPPTTTTTEPPTTTTQPPTTTLAPTTPPPQCPEDECQDKTCGFTPSDDNCAAFEKCVRLCECIIGSEVDGCSNDPLLHFPFTKDYNDDSCNHVMGKPFGGVSLEEGAVHFDGSGHIEVTFLKNYFRQNPTSSLTISLWFRSLASNLGNEGLLCNSGCVDTGSFALTLSGQKIQGKVNAAAQASFYEEESDTKVHNFGEWTLLTLVYSGLDAKFYINGKLSSEQPITGNIANSQCTMTIGSCDGNNFQGYIDDVRVFRRMLYDFDVLSLYNSGRQ